jgi:hypothetical protein
MTHEPPRRDRIDQFTPAERAIWDAAQAVEKAGADVRLTEALNLLHAARAKVADYVDTQPPGEGQGCALSDCHLCGQFREHGHDCTGQSPAEPREGGGGRDDMNTKPLADEPALVDELKSRIRKLEAALREGERLASTIVQHNTAEEGALYALGSWIPEARRALSRQ